MKIWLSPYDLKTKTGSSRPGYLLKVQEDQQEAGYSDLFVWPELGDPSFEEIPKLLNSQTKPPVVQRSLELALIDARARSSQVSLTQGLRLKNHYLMSSVPEQWLQELEQAFAQGFEKVKIKVGRDPSNEIPSLLKLKSLFQSEKVLRLDFNGRATEEYLQSIQPLTSVIDFVEDPSKEPLLWGDFGWSWAFDRPGVDQKAVSYDFRIIKPAIQSDAIEDGKPPIFTSYLGHPVGIAHSLVAAAAWGPQTFDYGLMSQNYYEPTPFHQHLQTEGPWLQCPSDVGIGFSDLLEQQRWSRV